MRFGLSTSLIPRTSAIEVISRVQTNLFSASSSDITRTFGQLLSSSFDSKPMAASVPNSSCPCCAFFGADLFLPLNYVNDSEEKQYATEQIEILSPSDAWKIISKDTCNSQVVLVDTHGHPHLERGVQYDDGSSGVDPSGNERFISLTCAVSTIDWKDTLDYASKSKLILPALGVHPWYLGDIVIQNNNPEESEKYLRWDWLDELEQHLSQHPNLIVGEIGLCKMARFVREFPKEQGGKGTALNLQKLVFRRQLELAAKWSRPVTVHCVNMHGALMEILEDILQQTKDCYKNRGNESEEDVSLKTFVRKAFPPSIAMHSFTGTSHHVNEILLFEEEVMNPDLDSGNKRTLKQKRPKVNVDFDSEETNRFKSGQNCLFYFGFSHAVNHVMCTSEKAKRKGIEAVQSIPDNRVLAESDVHATVDVSLGTAGAVAYIASARGADLNDVARQTTQNGLNFFRSLSQISQ